MGGHQRRRTRGVDGDRRALQPQQIGDAPGSHAGGPTGHRIALDTVRTGVAVGLGPRPGEHPGIGAGQPGRVDPGVFQRLPTHLQQHPLLGIDRVCFARGNPEKLRIKLRRPGHKTTAAGVGLAHRIRIGIEQTRHIPAPIDRKTTHRITPGAHQLPQIRRRIHPTGEPTRHPHHRHRIINPDRGRGDHPGLCPSVRTELGQEVVDHRGGGGVIEDQGRGQRQAAALGHGVA